MAAPTPALPRWEKCCAEEREGELTERLPVPGGWLYRTLMWNTESPSNELNHAVSMVFVPLASVPR